MHWGIPVLKIHFTHSDNDYKLIEDFQQNAEELFRKAGGEVMSAAPVAPAGFPGGPGAPTAPAPRDGRAAVRPRAGRRGDRGRPRAAAARAAARPLGGSIHEVGTARMSESPKRRRAQLVLPDPRYRQPVRVRRERVSVNRRQASDADDDGAGGAWLRSPQGAGQGAGRSDRRRGATDRAVAATTRD